MLLQERNAFGKVECFCKRGMLWKREMLWKKRKKKNVAEKNWGNESPLSNENINKTNKDLVLDCSKGY